MSRSQRTFLLSEYFTLVFAVVFNVLTLLLTFFLWLVSMHMYYAYTYTHLPLYMYNFRFFVASLIGFSTQPITKVVVGSLFGPGQG